MIARCRRSCQDSKKISPAKTEQIFKDTNCLNVAPTYDAYLDNGTNVGLTVGIIIITYAEILVNILQNYLTFTVSVLTAFLYVDVSFAITFILYFPFFMPFFNVTLPDLLTVIYFAFFFCIL